MRGRREVGGRHPVDTLCAVGRQVGASLAERSHLASGCRSMLTFWVGVLDAWVAARFPDRKRQLCWQFRTAILQQPPSQHQRLGSQELHNHHSTHTATKGGSFGLGIHWRVPHVGFITLRVYTFFCASLAPFSARFDPGRGMLGCCWQRGACCSLWCVCLELLVTFFVPAQGPQAAGPACMCLACAHQHTHPLHTLFSWQGLCYFYHNIGVACTDAQCLITHLSFLLCTACLVHFRLGSTLFLHML